MNEQMPIHEAFKILDEEGATRRERQTAPVTELPISKIKRMSGVFQPRSLIGNYSDDEEFVTDLVKALERRNGKPLDPITVWDSGGNFYVIDGHHRLEAYKRFWKSKSSSTLIPVSEFQGALEEAMELSGSSNSKNKLPMRQADRSNFAWRLVCSTSLSVSRVVAAADVSERNVKKMRSVRREIITKLKAEAPAKTDKDISLEIASMPWRDAMNYDRPMPPMEDWEKKEEEEAQRIAQRLQREFGGRLSGKVNVFARALVIYSDRLPKKIITSPAWQDQADELHEILSEYLKELEELPF